MTLSGQSIPLFTLNQWRINMLWIGIEQSTENSGLSLSNWEMGAPL
jgi:hypothetical protein